MDELEMLRRKKLEELRKRYMGGESTESMPDKPIEISDKNFDEMVRRYRNMAIDCWAPWCGPCLMIAPIIEELAREMRGKIVFGKLNVDQNPRTATKFNIMSIPTILLFKNGKLVDRIIGAMPKEALIERLRSVNMLG